MAPLVKEVVGSMLRYLDAIWPRGLALASEAARREARQTAATAPLSNAPVMRSGNLGKATPGGPSPSAPRRAPDATPDSDFLRRLASKNMQVAFANLGNAFQRMMLEPKSQQRFVAELNDLLVQSHALGAQMAASAPLLGAPPIDPLEAEGLDRALGDVRDNLVCAERADATPLPDLNELTLAIDSMVVAVEKEGQASPEVIQDLKLLAHQSKQMIAASRLIRKDLAAIRLPPSAHAGARDGRLGMD